MIEGGWFQDLSDRDLDGAIRAITDGQADTPGDWPTQAVETGFSEDQAEYYEFLHEATVAAASTQASSKEQATDQQLVHAVRTMDDLSETVNELAERAAEWAGSLFGESEQGLDYVLAVAEREPQSPVEAEVIDLARSVRELENRRQRVRTFVENQAPAVAPNLSTLAGPLLAARLIALAGGLQSLARKPSGTVQVLGAEDALFAHLEGHAPSPKHGIIFTHEYVRGTRNEKRGSAARALAGKLSIAARIDQYRGEPHPELEAELDERIETIRAGGEGE